MSTENEINVKLFSCRLSGAREKTSLSQGDLAEKIGVSLRTIQNWEGAKHLPRGKDLRNLAAALEVPVAYLLGLEQEAAREAASQSGDMRGLSHQHIDRVFDGCRGNVKQETWTYVELTRRLPINEPVQYPDPQRRAAELNESPVDAAARRLLSQHIPTPDDQLNPDGTKRTSGRP